MATLLINGAGRFGCNGFYQLCMSMFRFFPIFLVQLPNYYYFLYNKKLVSTVKFKMYNVSNHGVIDLVLKDFKKWTKGGDLTFVLSFSCIFT